MGSNEFENMEVRVPGDEAEDASSEAVNVRKISPRKQRASHDQKRAVFGRCASLLNKRGYRVVDKVPEFYYVMERAAMVCPPLDGLASSEIF